MDELVERVARELCRLDDQDPDEFFAEEPFWHLYKHDARAIIPIVQADQRARDAAIASTCMKLISIGKPGTGPFTRDDQVVDEVTEIIATAIRNQEPTDG